VVKEAIFEQEVPRISFVFSANHHPTILPYSSTTPATVCGSPNQATH